MSDPKNLNQSPAPQRPNPSPHPMAAPPPWAVPGENLPPTAQYGYGYNPYTAVKAPAVGLIIAGILSMISVVFIFIAPQMIEAFITLLQQQDAPFPQEDLDLLLEQLNKASDPTSIGNVFSVGATFTGGLVTTIAGFSMMRLQKWNLSLIGAILSIVPFTACCCTGAPLGIWALIILVKQEIKACFSHTT